MARPSRQTAILPERQVKGLIGENLNYSVSIVRTVCAIAGPSEYLSELRTSARRNGLVAAVRDHDTPRLFDWLVNAASFQGISDRVARNYMVQHGQARWAEIEAALAGHSTCPKLGSYWHFHDCRYQKGSGTCAEPEHLSSCPLPSTDLRNGNLNQSSYSLFLFIRDVANGDIVRWIDNRLEAVESEDPNTRGHEMGRALIEPMRNIFGVSDKVLNMILATLLLGAGRRKPQWVEAGVSLLAVDRLVHNFLARTGILTRANAEHAYGSQCYGPNGCDKLLRKVSSNINANEFNPVFPWYFPRFVQSSIWRYCAADLLNVCNGNQIDDSDRCQNEACRIFTACDRRTLKLSA